MRHCAALETCTRLRRVLKVAKASLDACFNLDRSSSLAACFNLDRSSSLAAVTSEADADTDHRCLLDFNRSVVVIVTE